MKEIIVFGSYIFEVEAENGITYARLLPNASNGTTRPVITILRENAIDWTYIVAGPPPHTNRVSHPVLLRKLNDAHEKLTRRAVA